MLLAVAALAAAPQSSADAGRPQTGRQQTDTTFAAQPGGRLRVDLHQGSLRVRSWDEPRVRIAATHSSRVRVRIRQSADMVRIEADPDGGAGRSVDYEITVPRSFGIYVDGVYAETAIENVDGRIRVHNVQGDIVVRDGRGELDLESVDGAIVVSGVQGRVDVESVNKGITITDVAGNVRAEAVNGSVQLAGIDADSVAVESLNGNLDYRGSIRSRGRYRFSTHNGAIRVAVPAGTDATVRVSTHNGSVQSDFPVQLRQMSASDRVTFVIGNGGARLDLESFGGSIRLLRQDAGR
jgi:DUF4097 and DUF4098 domain-containing protein YvlB